MHKIRKNMILSVCLVCIVAIFLAGCGGGGGGVAPSANRAPIVSVTNVTTTKNTAVQIPYTTFDADGDAVTLTTLGTNGSCVWASNAITFTPANNFTGSASCKVTPYDSKDYGTQKTATITVNDSNGNTVPVLGYSVGDTSITTGSSISVNLSSSTDADGDALTAKVNCGLGAGLETLAAMTKNCGPYNSAGNFSIHAQVCDALSCSNLEQIANVSVSAVAADRLDVYVVRNIGNVPLAGNQVCLGSVSNCKTADENGYVSFNTSGSHQLAVFANDGYADFNSTFDVYSVNVSGVVQKRVEMVALTEAEILNIRNITGDRPTIFARGTRDPLSTINVYGDFSNPIANETAVRAALTAGAESTQGGLNINYVDSAVGAQVRLNWITSGGTGATQNTTTIGGVTYMDNCTANFSLGGFNTEEAKYFTQYEVFGKCIMALTSGSTDLTSNYASGGNDFNALDRKMNSEIYHADQFELDGVTRKDFRLSWYHPDI